MATFGTLSDRLTDTFRNLRKKGQLSPADVDSTVREIRRALLDADVALPELTHYIPSDQARHQEQEEAEEAACDAESFSNIENAMWAADVLLETSGVKLAEGSDLEESPK